MKLARFGSPGSEKPALIDTQGRLRDLSEHLADIAAESLSDRQLEKIAAIDIDRLPLVDGHVRIGPPVARVGRIICIGLNYKDHAAETHLDLPEEPLVFLKGCHPSGPNDSIRLPSGSKKADWDVELAVVIGKRGLYIRKNRCLTSLAIVSLRLLRARVSNGARRSMDEGKELSRLCANGALACN
jgi:2,4-diketo-3-deoxy-L-fuconate hydrolase